MRGIVTTCQLPLIMCTLENITLLSPLFLPGVWYLIKQWSSVSKESTGHHVAELILANFLNMKNKNSKNMKIDGRMLGNYRNCEVASSCFAPDSLKTTSFRLIYVEL